MARWVNQAMHFALFFAFLAFLAVKLRCDHCTSAFPSFFEGLLEMSSRRD
jgi:hypothetical protein